MSGIAESTASAVVDLDAYIGNIQRLRSHVGETPTMVVVKADAYGHGLLPCARAAQRAGADWLGVATPNEAMALREAGVEGRLLCWLYGPDESLTPVVERGVDVGVHRHDQLSMIMAAAATTGRRARVHLKIDTGLFRNGSPLAAFGQLCAAARSAEESGAVQVIGVWSHFAAADEPGHPSIDRQLDAFEQALDIAAEHGLRPTVRHLANSAAALTLPQAHFDLVRLGIAAYGVEPAPGLAVRAGVNLEPVMTLRAQLAAVKQVPAGSAVSYGHTWTADRDTCVGLVPLGYADGIPRIAGNRAEVQVGDRRAPIRGRVCMDQFVVDLGPGATDRPGDEVIIFGSADRGPVAEDLAAACDTIGYEIVTRIGSRVPRSYLPGGAG